MSKVLNALIAKTGKSAVDFRSNSKIGEIFRVAGVQRTPEFERIARLPKRNWEDLLKDNYLETLSAYLRTPNGTQTLRPAQAALLTEAVDYGGAIGALGLGQGKTLLLAIAPTLMSCQRPLVLIPAKLREKTARDFKILRENWLVHPKITCISYETLGLVKNANLLEELNPDGIFCDEMHKLRNLKAARTKNVRRFKKKHPEVPMVFLSGTPWSRSLKDLWHFFLWALPADLMPLPRNYTELQEWCCAVDEKVQPQDRVQAGVLLDLAKGVEEELGIKASTDLERARLGLQRRIKATAGYVATVDSGVEASITIEKVKPPKVKAIDDALEELRETWCTPNGEELDSALAVWQYAQTLACGFYYKWNPLPPKSWKIARKSWSRYVRKVLEHSQNWQSPLHVSQGVLSGKLKEPHKEPHPTDPEKTISTPPKELLANWQREHAAYKYKKEAIWIDTTRMQWVAKNYLLDTKEDPIICWMMHTAIGEKLSELTKLPFCHTAGKDAKGRHIEFLEGSVIASIHTCGEGTNLQGVNGKEGWYRNLVLEWPTKGETCEQLIGRTHRSGQKADTVEFMILDSCLEQDNAFEQSLKDAQLQASLGGDYRRLLMADKL